MARTLHGRAAPPHFFPGAQRTGTLAECAARRPSLRTARRAAPESRSAKVGRAAHGHGGRAAPRPHCALPGAQRPARPSAWSAAERGGRCAAPGLRCAPSAAQRWSPHSPVPGAQRRCAREEQRRGARPAPPAAPGGRGAGTTGGVPCGAVRGGQGPVGVARHTPGRQAPVPGEDLSRALLLPPAGPGGENGCVGVGRWGAARDGSGRWRRPRARCCAPRSARTRPPRAALCGGGSTLPWPCSPTGARTVPGARPFGASRTAWSDRARRPERGLIQVHGNGLAAVPFRG